MKKNVLSLPSRKGGLPLGPEEGVQAAILAPSPLFLPGGMETSGSEKEARWAP